MATLNWVYRTYAGTMGASWGPVWGNEYAYVGVDMPRPQAVQLDWYGPSSAEETCGPGSTGTYRFFYAHWEYDEYPTEENLEEADYQEFDSGDLPYDSAYQGEEVWSEPGHYAFKVKFYCNGSLHSETPPSSVITIAPIPPCYGNESPTAEFFYTRADNIVIVNTSLSADAEDPKYKLNRRIDWGDGTHTLMYGLTTNAMHEYMAAGTYTITVTITDTCNASGSASDDVVIPSGPVWPPDGPPQPPDGPSGGSDDPPWEYSGLSCPVPSTYEFTHPCGLGVTEEFKEHLANSPTSLCVNWRVQRRDGVVFGFTSHTRDLRFDSGRGTELYRASMGMTPSGISVSETLQVDNMEVQAFFEDDAITDRDLMAGLFDDAEVEIFLLNYNDLSMGRLMGPVGHFGKVVRKEGSFIAEIRALSQKLSNNILDVTSELCRHSFGDDGCTKDLNGTTEDGYAIKANGWVTSATDRLQFGSNFSSTAPPPYVAATLYVWNSVEFTSGRNDGKTFSLVSFNGNKAVVFEDPLNEVKKIKDGDNGILHATRVSDSASVDFGFEAIDTINNGQEKSFVVDSQFWGSTPPPNNQTFPEAHFSYGTVTFTSGLNYGISREVKAFNGGFEMFEAFPFNISPNDHFEVVAGCDKRCETCVGKYNNAINFGAEPHIPGIEKILEVNKGD